MPSASLAQTGPARESVSGWQSWGLFVAEIALLVLLFASFTPGGLGGGIPGTNEAHYLCKAKKFWDPEFCPGDVFLESADAHFVFYYSFGWLTKFVDLPRAALVGRLISWISIAIGWQMLIQSICRTRFWSIPAAACMLLGLNYCHFAGEWLIGGVEAKGMAYAFVFAGLSFLIQKQWTKVWLAFGIAAAFHVLVGGWAVLAALIPWVIDKGWNRNFKPQLVGAVVGFLISLFGLVPALLLTMGQDSQVIDKANSIYTFERLAHHLLFSHISSTSPQRLDFFLFMVFAWIGLQFVGWEFDRFRQLSLFVAGTVVFAMVAIAIENYAESTDNLAMAARLLRYYWFRLSDVFVPVGVAAGLSLILQKAWKSHHTLSAIGLTVLFCLFAVHSVSCQLQHLLQRRSQADSLALLQFELADDKLQRRLNRQIIHDWIDVCSWIRVKTSVESRFLTPREQSTFKWYARRSEVVAWKDVPQDAIGIVNWRDRFEKVFGPSTFQFGLATLDAEERLIRLGKEFDAQYLVIERRHVRARKNELEYRYRYMQFVTGQTIENTPFDKPLALKQVYPSAESSEEIRKDSIYLVYKLEVPDQYQTQMKALKQMLNWYSEMAKFAAGQSN